MNEYPGVDFPNLAQVSDVRFEDEDERRETLDAEARAIGYLNSFDWCEGVEECFFGIGAGRILCVFLMKLKSSRADPLLWVIVGDIPPAYIVIDQAPSPVLALRVYLDEINKWIIAVLEGRTTNALIPVNASPNRTNALALKSRIDVIREEFLPLYDALS